jgi:SpoIID/LytB domain protein
LCASEHCQVYAGQGREDPRTTAAIAATRGEFLVRDDGSLVDAVYSSSCGGHTENNEAVWGGTPDPALRGQPDSFCGNRPWQTAISVDALQERAGVGRLREVAVAQRGVSGRATRLHLIGDSGETEIKGELAIRHALGNLKSSKLALRADKDAAGHVTALSATGSGHGHGVGMCQEGAVGMARAGRSYPEILTHYYPGTRLRKLY